MGILLIKRGKDIAEIDKFAANLLNAELSILAACSAGIVNPKNTDSLIRMRRKLAEFRFGLEGQLGEYRSMSAQALESRLEK